MADKPAGWVERSETHLCPLEHDDGFHFVQPILRSLASLDLPAQQLSITVKSLMDARCAQCIPHHR